MTVKTEPVLEQRVIEFLSEFCAVQLEMISPESEIVKDLRMEGDDAAELMENFAVQFDVDMSDFELSDYFVPESYFSPLIALLKMASGNAPKLKKLYVRNLLDAASLGRWPR